MIEEVYKRRRKRNGKTVTDRTYTGRYRVGTMDKPRTVALGVNDKRVATQKLRSIVEAEERKQAGIVDPLHVAASAELTADALDDYVADLKTQGLSGNHISNVRCRVTRTAEACGWMNTTDATASSFQTWRNAGPRSLRADRPISRKTLNDYLAACKAFFTWLEDGDRITRNPLGKVKPIRGTKDDAASRRPLTIEEARRLMTVAGPRRVLYLAALLTSYRRGTLRDLRWRHVDLDGPNPRFNPPASTIKNRTAHPLPIRDDLVAALLGHRPADFSPDGHVFRDVLPRWGIDFLRRDLEAAKIAEKTPAGIIDFHALRHTAATWAQAEGASTAQAQALTGHKTRNALDSYTHTDQMPVAATIDTLPRFDLGNDGTHIGTHAAGTDGRDLSQADAAITGPDSRNPKEKRALGHAVTQGVAACRKALKAVSYTHLTLPTICSV